MTPEEFDRHITMCLYGRGRMKRNLYNYYLLEKAIRKGCKKNKISYHFITFGEPCKN